MKKIGSNAFQFFIFVQFLVERVKKAKRVNYRVCNGGGRGEERNSSPYPRLVVEFSRRKDSYEIRATRLTREGCVIAVRVRGCGGSVDERLRRRGRRPVLVGGRGVRVVRRMVAESSRTTQKQTAVTRHGRHVMVMVLVHSPAKIDSRVRRKETKRNETKQSRRTDESEGKG